MYSGNHNTAERLYIHGWTTTNGIIHDIQGKIGQANNDDSTRIQSILFNVIDGADSTFGTVAISPSCVSGTLAPDTGGRSGPAGIWSITSIRHVSNGVQNWADCLLDSAISSSTSSNRPFGGRHGNVVEIAQRLGNLCVKAKTTTT